MLLFILKEKKGLLYAATKNICFHFLNNWAFMADLHLLSIIALLSVSSKSALWAKNTKNVPKVFCMCFVICDLTVWDKLMFLLCISVHHHSSGMWVRQHGTTTEKFAADHFTNYVKTARMPSFLRVHSFHSTLGRLRLLDAAWLWSVQDISDLIYKTVQVQTC